MRTNCTKQLLKSGQAAVGSMLNCSSLLVAEIMAHTGFDFLIIDLEHGENDLGNLQAVLQVISSTPTTPLVRLPAQDMVFIKRSLDLGAYGLVVPQVETAEQAREIVSAVRYPAQGQRSWGTPRGLLYGGDDYFEHAAEELLVVAMLETASGAENAGAIMAVDGIDACFIGPNDLSISLGFSPEAKEFNDVVELAVQNIRRSAVEHGKAAGIQNYTPTAARDRIEQGFTFIGMSTDIRFLRTAARQSLAEVRA